MRYFLRLAYDGTDFHGWQRQPNGNSVQQTIESALSTIFQKEMEIVGAGRTDAGVHASEMYAHFDCSPIGDKKRFLKSLNLMVGTGIAINELLEVKEDAHARFDAVSRTYKYYISTEKNPFGFRYTCLSHKTPDLELMNKAGQLLLATDDFTSFAKLHSDAKTNICKVSKAEWTEENTPGTICFTITANRFLRNMVRAVVGTLVEVGNKKITLDEFQDIINKKNRCAAGVSMPAKGLFLTKIEYPKEIFIL